MELGRSGEPANDLLGNVDPAKTRLDAIQVALLMSRLVGELSVLEQKTARLNYSHATSANWQSPCPTNDTQDVILDYDQIASTTLFGILAERLGGRLDKYGRMAGIANIVATVFKFILSYALLDVGNQHEWRNLRAYKKQYHSRRAQNANSQIEDRRSSSPLTRSINVPSAPATVTTQDEGPGDSRITADEVFRQE